MRRKKTVACVGWSLSGDYGKEKAQNLEVLDSFRVVK